MKTPYHVLKVDPKNIFFAAASISSLGDLILDRGYDRDTRF